MPPTVRVATVEPLARDRTVTLSTCCTTVVSATVSVTALLIIVAVSDLHDPRPASEPPLDDAAALADGTAAAPLRTSRARTTAKRR